MTRWRTWRKGGLAFDHLLIQVDSGDQVGKRAYCMQLIGILLHRLGIQDLTVMLTSIQILLLMLRERNLLLKVPKLQVRDIILLLHRWIIHPPIPLLLLPLLLFLLNLLGRPLGLPREIFRADFSAQDRGLGPIAFFYAQCYLFKDEFGFLAALHGAKGFDLQFAEDIGCGVEVALGFLHVGEDAGNPRSLDFNKDLWLV